MKLFEPQRGIDLLQFINTWASANATRFHVISLTADIIVFAFPVFLLIVYCIGMRKNNITLKKYTLSIFFSTFIAAIINIIIQLFFDKARPETVLEGTDRLILKHLPTMSFPSDHAAVSMAFGVAVYYFAKYISHISNKNIYKKLGILFVLGSIAMSLSRVSVGIHWPTDILAGWIVGILAVYLVRYVPNIVYEKLIALEVYLFGLVKNLFGNKK